MRPPVDERVLGSGGRAEYRSAIFYHSPEQKATAERVTAEVQAKHFDPKGQKIVTLIEEAREWYDAEDYHQLYLFNVRVLLAFAPIC